MRTEEYLKTDNRSPLIWLVVQSMRPLQWYKNLVIFIALVFSRRFVNFGDWVTVTISLVIFCFLTGAIYMMNDCIDKKADQNHPRKALLPIASGALGIPLALSTAAVLMAGSLVASWFLGLPLFACAAGYIVLQSFYSLGLKRIFIVDILAISTGFVLRVIAGAVVIDVLISPWLVVCTFELALVLALAKREDEVNRLGVEANSHRKSLAQYSAGMNDRLLNIACTALVVSYLLYTTSLDHWHMLLTVPFATYCVFRYLYLVSAKDVADKAERVLVDKPMLVALVLWIGVAMGILTFWP